MTDHDRFRELAAGAADDILSPDEARDFALHVRTCPACRAEVHAFARDREMLGRDRPDARVGTADRDRRRFRTAADVPSLATPRDGRAGRARSGRRTCRRRRPAHGRGSRYDHDAAVGAALSAVVDDPVVRPGRRADPGRGFDRARRPRREPRHRRHRW